jgi:hypothetical protein
MGTPLPRFGPQKLAKSRGIEDIPPRTPLTLEHQKPQNQAPLLTDLGGESRGKEPRRVHAYIPHQIPKREASKTLQENYQEKSSENHQKERTGTTHSSLEEPRRIIYTSQRGSYKV